MSTDVSFFNFPLSSFSTSEGAKRNDKVEKKKLPFWCFPRPNQLRLASFISFQRFSLSWFLGILTDSIKRGCGQSKRLTLESLLESLVLADWDLGSLAPVSYEMRTAWVLKITIKMADNRRC